MGAIIRVLLTVLSGVGVGSLVDKVAGDKLPVSTNVIKDDGKFLQNVGVFVVLSVVGSFIVSFFVKKFKLSRSIKF